jgi:hypothetical protein
MLDGEEDNAFLNYLISRLRNVYILVLVCPSGVMLVAALANQLTEVVFSFEIRIKSGNKMLLKSLSVGYFTCGVLFYSLLIRIARFCSVVRNHVLSLHS